MNFWFNVGTNIFSDVIFVVVIFIFAWVFWAVKAIPKARRFFGTSQDAQLNIHLSIHDDPRTTTRSVVTLEEFEAAEAFKGELTHKLRESIFGRFSGFMYGLIGLEPNIPEPKFKYTRTTDTITQTPQGGTVIVGGPVRNKLTDYVLNNSNPWFDFDSTNNEFVIIKGNRAGERLVNSGKSAVVEKVIIDGKVVILAYGFGETHTKAAVNYLSSHWMNLYKKFNERPFAIFMTISTDGEVQIIEEFID